MNTPRAYYNEYDPKAAAWLRELIRRGLIADGEVDDRSILDVRPVDLAGFTQCHFFAGIGGWSYALRLAGWPDDRPVWTGSPPCQPFSSAGRRLGRDDERHLAPHFVDLVRSCRPPMLFGEQVASSEVFGKPAKASQRNAASAPQWAWLDDLSDRLEAAQYAVGASDIPAAGVGAPHIRQRTFFGAVRLADAEHSFGRKIGQHREDGRDREDCGRQETHGVTGTCGEVHGVADPVEAGQRGQRAHDDSRSDMGAGIQPSHLSGCGASGGLADAAVSGRQQGGADAGRVRGGDHAEGAAGRPAIDGHMECVGRPDAPHGGWADADWLYCRDDRWRPVEPGTFPLAHGIPARVGLLRGYGNAIVPQAAAEFIAAFLNVLDGGQE